MTMRFGVLPVTDRPDDELFAQWKLADDLGLECIGIPDSPAIAREMFLSVSDCLGMTTRAEALTAVSNPVTRDPSVTAAALATIAKQYPSRVSYGIGTGDSALWGVGLRQARLERLGNYIDTVKTLLRGEAAEFEGRTIPANWIADDAAAAVKVYVACSGPQILRMAAERADGLILAMGFSDENLALINQTIEEGCASVHRDPSELDIWWHSTAHFGASIEEAKATNLGVPVGWMTMRTMDGKQIPEHYKEALVELTSHHRNLENEYSIEGVDAALVVRAKELGIYDWLISRAPGLWGTSDDVARRLVEFNDRGMTQWLFYVGGPDQDRRGFISQLGTEVVPAVNRALASRVVSH